MGAPNRGWNWIRILGRASKIDAYTCKPTVNVLSITKFFTLFHCSARARLFPLKFSLGKLVQLPVITPLASTVELSSKKLRYATRKFVTRSYAHCCFAYPTESISTVVAFVPPPPPLYLYNSRVQLQLTYLPTCRFFCGGIILELRVFHAKSDMKFQHYNLENNNCAYL